MAVAYRSSSNTGTSDSYVTSVNVPVPSSAATNDIAVVALEQWEVADPTVTLPSGFAQLTSHLSGQQKLKVFWKRLAGADSGNYTFTWSGSQWTMGHCILLTGVKTSGDPIGSNFNNANSASGTTIPTATVTTLFAPGLVHFVANENAASKTAPTSFTEVQDGDYIATNYRIPGIAGVYAATGGTLSTSSLSLVTLLALEPATGGQSAAANTATETDTSITLGRAKRRTANFPSSTDAAISLARSKRLNATLAAETDSALALARGKRRTATQALETDTALPLGRARARVLSLAAETEVALPLGKAKSKPLARPDEVDSALPFGSIAGRRLAIGTALETETALPLGHRRARTLGIALELDSALPVVMLEPVAPTKWQLTMPLIRERWTMKGSLSTSTYREATVFGDEAGLFTTQRGSRSPGSDSYGAIPFGTKYIWYGGHINITEDPAVRDLWIQFGYATEAVLGLFPGDDVFPSSGIYPGS